MTACRLVQFPLARDKVGLLSNEGAHMGFAAPAPQIERDRWDRPIIRDVNGENPQSYQRVTKFIDVIENKYNLERWSERMVAIGIAKREDLRLSVLSHLDDSRQLNNLTWDAKKAAGADAAATKGTAVHALTELIDRGQPLPDGLPPVHAAMVEAYREATKDLTFSHIEQFLVNDKMETAGTADRVAKLKGVGAPFIADLKTGSSIEFGFIKIAMQLSIYAHSAIYDVSTYQRKPLTVNGVNVDGHRALIIHLPMVDRVEDVKCDLVWIDIESAWEWVKLARRIHDVRKTKFKDVTEVFDGKPSEISLFKSKVQEGKEEAQRRVDRQRAINGIGAATSRQMLENLWQSYQHVWDDELTAMAKKAITELPVND